MLEFSVVTAWLRYIPRSLAVPARNSVQSLNFAQARPNQAFYLRELSDTEDFELMH
ncbi:MAG: hypothetical protein HQ517_09860 [SAR324 cluster bacterium]|nr:hypothetical protein [SAR324 cluster bacterium]